MTENDYIAEYVKEKFPNLLGADYAVWSLGKRLNEVTKTLSMDFTQKCNNEEVQDANSD